MNFYGACAGLKKQVESGIVNSSAEESPQELLAVNRKITMQLMSQARTYFEELLPELRNSGIFILITKILMNASGECRTLF
jgi:polyphosphate kinase